MTDDEWFAQHTDGAPVRLRERADHFFRHTGPNAMPRRLAIAANAALTTASGATSRDAALDLLAADALITLALLAAGERDPASLAVEARALRELAA
ncbi:MAG: hypothetical protein ABIR59_02500 [Gemmatimonadales bacterium]